MKNAFIVSVIFIFLLMARGFAETSIKAEVDKTDLTTDEALTYKLIITSSEKQIANPKVPKFEGFRVISQAHSSTMSFVKSNIKTILVYAFILAPVNIGKFKIEPSTIKMKDKVYSTDTFEIEVRQGRTKPQIPETQKPPSTQKPQTETEQSQTTL